MKMLIPAVSALALTLAIPQPAEAQDRGGGRGEDRGKSGQDRGRGGPDRSGPQSKGPPADRGSEARRQDRGRDARPEQARRAVEQHRDDARRQVDDRRDEARRRLDDRREDARRGFDDRRDEVRRRIDDGPGAVFFRAAPDRGLIAGCPPGLARKDNGCLPPGQARKLARDYARYDYVWDRRDRGLFRYDDGYLYRYDPQGSLLGWMPVLGGALGLGSVWPTQYRYEPAPTYYVNYFQLPDRYDYRYADGVLYGLDPQTQAISQIAALLTGQQWTVGQPMPAGYDIYNVPYDSRARYYDTPDRWYRYSDGYVYQVDPTTRLVQAVVQLLT